MPVTDFVPIHPKPDGKGMRGGLTGGRCLPVNGDAANGATPRNGQVVLGFANQPAAPGQMIYIITAASTDAWGSEIGRALGGWQTSLTRDDALGLAAELIRMAQEI